MPAGMGWHLGVGKSELAPEGKARKRAVVKQLVADGDVASRGCLAVARRRLVTTF